MICLWTAIHEGAIMIQNKTVARYQDGRRIQKIEEASNTKYSFISKRTRTEFGR